MARKERVLARLEAAEEHMRRAMETGSGSSLTAAGRELAAASALCRQGLSEDSYTAYGEIYDGLALAIGQMEENAADRQEEAMLLCGELLEHLARETRKEKRFKKDIVFLPYKSSMWDSLESVWKAADEDRERCNAYVIPIPYADRNPDGSIADWQCERSQFPSYVPTLDWQEVDLREWHPDVIFIHNPYDNQNRVTSVEQRFYSGNLKECTDKLVYIPYFVLEEPHPGNEAEEEAISHFVLTPGVLNADQVIVQSEAMREVYINVLSKGTNQQDRGFWEQRISGAGSPKIDKVLTSRKEDFYLPEKWRRLVEGKKVILYNTSVSAMLEHSDRVCDKLCYVFDVFRNRNDVALWWRPHPLMKSTIHSMRPEIEERYCEIERKYIEEGWGIYDDSPDLHRAIAWSDAYYGDGSSVIQIYRRTKKPIVLQQIENKENQSYINFWNVAVADDGVFFIETYRSTIYKWDVLKNKVMKVVQIPSLYIKNTASFGTICRVDRKTLILPLNATDILEYDEVTGKIAPSFQIHNSYQKDGNAVIVHCVSYESFRYFIGIRCSEIIKYDTKKNAYTRLTKWFKLVQQYVREGAECSPEYDLLPNYCTNGNRLFLPFAQANIVIELNMDTDEFLLHEIGGKNNRYQDMIYDGRYYWLLQHRNAPVVRWSEEDENVREFGGFMDTEKDALQDLPFNFICKEKNELYLYPWMGKYKMMIDTKRDVSTAEHYEGLYYFISMHSGIKTSLVVEKGKSILLFNDGERNFRRELTANDLERDLDVSLIDLTESLWCDSFIPIEKIFSFKEASIRDRKETAKYGVVECGKIIYRDMMKRIVVPSKKRLQMI